LKEFASQSPTPIRSVMVVSDAYHMRRARWITQKLLDDEIQVQMAPIPIETSPYQRRWWTDVKSRQYVKNEYVKLIYYLFRYQFA
jgi:uncharacterized SAM-binding protein YcdF (DUF218 family)